MRLSILILTMVGLVACSRPVIAPLSDIPADVLAHVPTDIDISELNRDPDGCYFYTYAADLFVVKDAQGQPVCVTDQ